MIRTLAEPNLTAISGKSATFIAGGEFPVPAGYYLRSDQRMSVRTPDQLQEVRHLAELHAGRADRGPHQPAGDDRGLRTVERQLDHAVAAVRQLVTVPSIKTRRAETTLEIPSGGAMAMAGLIQEQTKQAINGLPGLMQLPILGTLFRSRDFVNNQTELMVLVTPYIVRAVAQKDLSRPDDGFAAPADPQAELLGNINRIYGVPGRSRAGAELSRHLRLYHRLRRERTHDDIHDTSPIVNRSLRHRGGAGRRCRRARRLQHHDDRR